ncbi:MAG: hypothetical protein V9F06_03695 [Thermomicrobiales bacterium]
MKKPSRFLRVVATLGMLAGLLAVLGGTPAAAAAPSPGWDPGVAPGNLFFSIGGAQEVYFPWVYNNDSFGLGEANGSVTVQNLTHVDGYVFFYVGDGDGWTYTSYANLAGGASKTFSAASIGVPAPGAPVMAAIYEEKISYDGTKYVCEGDYGHDINADGDFNDCDYIAVRKNVLVPLWAAGLVKSAVAGASLPYTTSADSSVSGYNGLSGAEVGRFDEHYLPIVQTNSGPGGAWDTRVTVANLRGDANAGVELRFFPNNGDGSGSLQTGWQQSVLVNPGAVYQLTLSDWVPEGWTGAVHIYSDTAVGVIADRYKAGTNMWLTNTGSNANFEWDNSLYGIFTGQYVLFAPLVYMDYNGWNTGFSVANLVSADNNINIQYVHNGNAIQVLTQRLSAHGMITAYRPSQPDQDQNQQNVMFDQVAGALILSDAPVAVAVDAVKYFGNDNNVGQAMTYNATAALSTAQAMPLVQKGNPATGMGATSGLALLNPLPLPNAMAVTWLNQSGYNAANFGTSTIIVPAQSIGIAYTMTQHNLPNGYYGSAVVHANLPFTMVSANVDYQVQGDGSVIWNGYNPCGLFRAYQEDCVWGWPEQPGLATLTKIVVDKEGNPIAGVKVTFDGQDVNGDLQNGEGYTDADGIVSWSSLVAGTYNINVVGAPAGYMFGPDSDLSDTKILLIEGASVTKTNIVTLIRLTATITKTVVSQPENGYPMVGMTVAVYAAADCPALGDTVADTSGALASGTTDANGQVELTFDVSVGGTAVCVVVINGSGKVVSVDSGLTYGPAATDEITNVVAATATITKTVVRPGPADGADIPIEGVAVALYGGGSCPAVGTTAVLANALTSGTTDANGEVALTIDVATTGASVCLVVLDANNKVVSLDSSVPMLYPGDDVQVWNKISTFLDVWLANGFWLSIDGVAIFVFDHACPAGGPGTSGAFWKATRVPAMMAPTQWSIPIPPGPFCVAIGIYNDKSVNAWAGGTILLGDPVETGSTSSDVIIKPVSPGLIATITIQP